MAVKFEKWLTPDGLTLLRAWARDGLIDRQISAKMGVAEKTLTNWKKKFPEIKEALAKGKEIVDIQVENALLNNALGYYYTEDYVGTEKKIWYENGKRYETIGPKKIEVQKWHPGETGAQCKWLKNRKPREWPEHPLTTGVEIEDIEPLAEMLK